MIEKSLADKLGRIFGLKVAFDIPGDSREQEVTFVQVESNRSTIKDEMETAQVRGKLRIFANSAKLPLGYIAKRIAKAKREDVRDLVFFDIEENAGTFNNIVERSIGFVYFYKNQYHPERGEMNETEITVEVTE